ncbi:beta-N-acetylglucosaminidase domain-containing protein [Streptomyces sp. t39]|uniref:beta-N-acetylglucosaminidase domain-containing protein n=1 Tax=Streptomyces sp. t39 TaxID=1828156 RepID=UPI0011CE674B|nr:beta-N-acetylglucosaminidase domain-containing protein [Streptomyces sp. t39]TXS55192.1 hyaluronidase [Streptomyces sp. t39]
MRLAGRRRTAAALAVAVIGGLLGGAPTAVAAPGDPAAPAGSAQDPEGTSAVPAVWPRPQSLRAGEGFLALGAEATLVAAPSADPYAVALLKDVLREAGVRTVHEALPGRGPVFRLGGPDAGSALRALRAADVTDLPRGGYRLASGEVAGRATVALDGVGDDGLFHGVQTLRRLVTERGVPHVVIRDWPGTAVRGTTEGFYGTPWTHRQRLEQLDFMGRTKQNRYLYAPGDDPYRQAMWREAYPADRRAEFRELAERARRNHVVLAWAVAPAQSMCLSDDGDIRALTRKIDAMWALGVRAFQLQFQDVSYSEWHCDRDARAFGSGPAAAAKAHARVADAVARHLADRHPGAEQLSVVPTEYYQDGTTDYRRALAGELDDGIRVAWTGVGVVPRTITGRELTEAQRAFGHPLVTMDNYPVNDWAQDRIFLGPYTGREPAVAGGSAALLVNAMEQASASRIPLFTAADFAWNPKGYRPQESWRAALDDLAGGDARAREALGALAGNDASSILSPDAESAYLRPLMDEFWRTRATTDAPAQERAAVALRSAFGVMREAPARLRSTAGGDLADEVRPWLDQLARYGRAGEKAVDMLLAQTRGDGQAAWDASLALEPLRGQLAASRATVGKGVLGAFLARAEKESRAWTGADRAGAVADRDTVSLGRPRPVTAVTTMTEPGHASPGHLEGHVPGEGWRRLAPLSAGGWTQTDVRELTVDALRVAADGPGQVTVRSLVPWFADEPAAGLALDREQAGAEIGGAPLRTDVRLTAQRPGEVRGELTATAPAGIEVRVPERTTVPRGTRTTVPVEVTVPEDTPSGEYRVPFAFAGQRSTLTVRAFPRTGGPDLARAPGARASASGEETADFPASAAADGDGATRWSSPTGPSAWWQVELARPARVGQVVLHWQDAYATSYRIQVSADGTSWRTAATVTDGRGGRESVRLDAKDTRFVRVQGDERATRFGYSLFGVETYAVADR